MPDTEELSTATESTAPGAASPSTTLQPSESSVATDEAGLLQTAPESEDEEYEVTGEKYRLPKKLIGHLKELEQGSLRQEDYTRKTQSVADQVREVEARTQQLQAREQFQMQHVQDVAKVIAIDDQLAQYAKLDWDSLSDADPVQAQKLDRKMRDLQQQRTQIVTGIEQKQAQVSQARQQETARSHQLAREELQREIKGFDTPEVQKALIQTAREFGFKPEELASVSDPRAVRLLHEAHLYRKLKAELSAKAPKPEVKPITRVQAGENVVKKSISDPNISVEEYIRLRNEKLRRR